MNYGYQEKIFFHLEAKIKNEQAGSDSTENKQEDPGKSEALPQERIFKGNGSGSLILAESFNLDWNRFTAWLSQS